VSAFALDEGSSGHRAYKFIGWGLFVLVAVAAPFWAVHTPAFSIGDSTFTFSLGNLSHAVAYMVGVLGLGLLVGYNGQISLGNSFFMGVGAYLTATLVADNGWPHLLTLVVVIPVTFVIGMLVGVPALRIRGLYLALVTLGLAAVFPALVRLDQVRDQTGGANGKRIGESLEPPSWFPLEDISEGLAAIPLLGEWLFGDGRIGGRDETAVWTYLILAALAGLSFWLVRNLIYSRPGRSIIAIRDNETGAAVSGVHLSLTKTLTFGMSAALGGVSGTMYIIAIGFVAPDVFGVNLAIFLIVGLVVGGVGTLSGAVIGGLVIIFVPLWASQVASVPGVPERYLRGPTGTLFLGLLLIILTFVLPGGVIYGARRLRAKLLRIRPRGATNPDEDVLDVQAASETMLERRPGAGVEADPLDPGPTAGTPEPTRRGAP
jgi:branched-chain amino acid transport system permease protein